MSQLENAGPAPTPGPHGQTPLPVPAPVQQEKGEPAEVHWLVSSPDEIRVRAPVAGSTRITLSPSVQRYSEVSLTRIEPLLSTVIRWMPQKLAPEPALAVHGKVPSPV